MQLAPNAWDKIKVEDVVVGTDHEIFFNNRFPRLIALLTSTIFVSETSGIKAILEYRSVIPIIVSSAPPNKRIGSRKHLTNPCAS